jgi:hypothetical protein
MIAARSTTEPEVNRNLNLPFTGWLYFKIVVQDQRRKRYSTEKTIIEKSSKALKKY